MNALTAQRQLAAELMRGAGYTAHDSLTDRLTVPAVIVTAGAPWITRGERFGTHLVRWRITCVVAQSSRPLQQTELDGYAVDAATALADDFAVESIGEPYQLTAGTGTYTAVDVTVTITDTITTGED